MAHVVSFDGYIRFDSTEYAFAGIACFVIEVGGFAFAVGLLHLDGAKSSWRRDLTLPTTSYTPSARAAISGASCSANATIVVLVAPPVN